MSGDDFGLGANVDRLVFVTEAELRVDVVADLVGVLGAGEVSGLVEVGRCGVDWGRRHVDGCGSVRA